MRLHLPKGLLTAILAACAALPTWAESVTHYIIEDRGTVDIALTSAGEQLLFDGTTGEDTVITYSGNISVDGTHWCGPGPTAPDVNTSSYYVKLTGNLTDSETSNSGSDVLKFNGYANRQGGTTVGNNVVWELSGTANTYSGNIEVGHGGDAASYSQLTLSTAFTQTSGFPAVTLTHDKTILNIGASMTLAGLATEGTASDRSVTSTSANNTLTLNVESGTKTFNGSVGVGNYFTEDNYGGDMPGTTSSAINLTKTGGGTQVINGQVNLGAVTISGGKLALNTGSATSFSSLRVQDATLELSGAQTAITVGTAEQAGSSTQRQSYDAKSPKFQFSGGASLTINGSIWLNNATLHLEGTGTGGGSLLLHGLNLGYKVTGANVGNVSIGSGTTLRITGTATSSSADDGLIIWNNQSHVLTIGGSMIVEHKIRAHSSDSGANASSATFNIGSTGLLQLSEGIDFVSNITSITSLGTINVNGGTLAIGGSVEGSKATVNLKNGAKVVALDAATLSGQQFTIADNATVTFSGKGVDGSADNTLTLTQAINKDSAVIQALGNVALNAGGTVKQLNAGTDAGSSNLALGGDTTVSTFVDITADSTLTVKEGKALSLTGTGGGQGIWMKTGSTVTIENGASVSAFGFKIANSSAGSNATLSLATGTTNANLGTNPEGANLVISGADVTISGTTRLQSKIDGGTLTSDVQGASASGSVSVSSVTVKEGKSLDLSGQTSVTGTTSIEGNASLSVSNAQNDLGTLTGSGALKSTAGAATVRDASGFTGTLESTGGALTATNVSSTNKLAAVKASGGQISLYAEDASVSVEELAIGTNGQTLAYTGQMELGTVTADKVSIGESNAKFQGNLNITDGLTVQVGSNGQTGGLNMAAAFGGAASGTLTLGSATGTGIELNLSYIPVMTTNDTLTLFSGVERVLYYEIISAGTGETEASAVTLSDTAPSTLTADAVDASKVFNNVDSGFFTVKFVGNNVILTASSNVPEPTTATLSLLALMGLAARRRRRKA